MDNNYLNNKGDNSMVQTSDEIIKNTQDKVKTILNQKFQNHIEFDDGRFVINRGSTQVMILVRPFTETETCVECIANVVVGAEINNEISQFLLRKNAEIHFGAFGLLFDNTITFSHTIAGKNLDENELLLTANAVAVIADHYDDEIVAIAGGKRAVDALEDEL